MDSLKGKKIVLGISGGIAVYKSVILLRLLKKAGADVQVIMTDAAKEFVNPVTFSSLSGNPVISEFFTANTGNWHSHVKLGLWADLMVIAPATANTLAKMATGVADNMLLTSYLSTRSEVMVAPAMDFDMWLHPTTGRNIATLKEDKVYIIPPASGELASGLSGQGRMAEPEDIFDHIVNFFRKKSTENNLSAGDVENRIPGTADRQIHEQLPLQGRTVLVTAGPTYEMIDPVRYIGNFSSGKMGFSLARVLAEVGARVILVAGPTNQKADNPRIKRINVRSADEMLENCLKYYSECQIAFFSAAVADYKPEIIAENKIKREGIEEMSINLVKNPDIAAILGKEKKDRINIGFALESENEQINAIKKLRAKNFDWIVLNSINDPEAGFNKDTNKVTLYSKAGDIIQIPAAQKIEIAKKIIEYTLLDSAI